MADPHTTSIESQLAELGRAESAHPVRVTSTSLILLCAGAFFLLSAGLCVVIYFKVPFKKDDPVPPETMLYIAAGIAATGVLSLLGACWKGDLGKRAGDGYLLYREALALIENETCTVVRWEEVTGLVSPAGSSGEYRLTTRAGRTVPIRRDVKDYSNLIGSVVTRVTDELLPPLQSALNAGETVTFGPFEVSHDKLGYKGKILDWDKVAVLRVEIGALGRRLRVRASGSLLPWCFCNLESFPNGVLFPDLLRSVCPSRLMVPVRR